MIVAMGYPGARICTVLTYLKAPEIGGETEFPHIGVTVPISKSNYCIAIPFLPP